MTPHSIIRALPFFFFISITAAFAQRNRPVAEDCMRIMDILSKDYGGFDALQRESMVMEDHELILKIIRNYIEPQYNDKLGRYQSTFVNSLSDQRNLIIDNLRKFQTAKKKEEKEVYLKNYNDALKRVKEMELKKYTDMLSEFSDASPNNPFLKDLLANMKAKFEIINSDKVDKFAKNEITLESHSIDLLSAGSALTFTNAIDAFSKVVVKRIKEELANQVFEKIRYKLGEQSFEELRLIFPITVEYLTTATADEYPRLLTALQQNIHEDLNNIIKNLPALENTQHVKALLAANPELRFILEGLKFIQQVKLISSPPELITFIENSSYVQQWASDATNIDLFNLGNGIKTATLIIKSLLIEKDGKTTIITSQAWETYEKDIKFYTTFFALLYEQDKHYYHIRFIINDNQQELNTLFTQLRLSRNYNYDYLQVHFGKPVKNLLYEANALAQQIKIINERKDKVGADSLTAVLFSSIACVQQTGHLATNFLRLLEGAQSIPHYSYLDLFEKQFDKYISYARHPVTIYDFMTHKSYAAAVNYAWNSIVEISGNPVQPRDKELILKITNFLVEVERAKTSEDFVAAIDNFALPAGSSALKRKSKFTLSLNTYPGLMVAAERLNGSSFSDDNLNQSPWAFNAALTVPVGIAASWGTKHSPRSKKERALSFFVSVIDIGAITSLRFQDDQTELPELEFKNIFAPGIHFYYGFHDSPFSLGAGAQFGPMLRELKVDNNGVIQKEEVSSFRLAISLTIDIPIFNFHNRAF